MVKRSPRLHNGSTPLSGTPHPDRPSEVSDEAAIAESTFVVFKDRRIVS
jgi:hypothetical protein